VRTLVRSELGGTIDLRPVPNPGHGAEAVIEVPIA
jgi:hypothetical protein